MKTKMFISICLLLASITAQAALPQGKWKVQQVTIEKNTDGNTQTTVYNTAADVQSYIPCPQEWDINAKNIVQRYPDGTETTANYSVDGNKLTVLTMIARQSYQYSTSGNDLILTIVYNYVNNLPTGKTERITENRTINLKK